MASIFHSLSFVTYRISFCLWHPWPELHVGFSFSIFVPGCSDLLSVFLPGYLSFHPQYASFCVMSASWHFFFFQLSWACRKWSWHIKQLSCMLFPSRALSHGTFARRSSKKQKSAPEVFSSVSCFSSFSLPWRSWTPSSHGYHSQGCLLPSLCVSMRSSEAPLIVGILEEKVIIKALQEPPGLLEMLMKVIFTPDISLSLSKLGQYSHYSRVYDWALYQPFLRSFTGSCSCHHYFAYNNCTN